jgi:hypothetical protein
VGNAPLLARRTSRRVQYAGDLERIATELLSNQIYHILGIRAPGLSLRR